MAERDFAEIARLSERFNKDPTSRIFVQLADAYRKNKMIDEALDTLNQGIEHHPGYALAHLIRGKCFFDMRNYNRAKESFEKTIELDPQNVVAYRMLAQTCAFVKDEEGLIAAYKGILALDPHDIKAKEQLASLASEEKQGPMYTVSMAQEYEQQGNMKKALEVYEHLLYTDPSDLLLQQKVKALKGSLEQEIVTKQPETDTTYRLEDITQQPDAAQVQPQAPQPPGERTPEIAPEEPAKQEDVISLEEILTEKTAETLPFAEPEEAVLEVPEEQEIAETPSDTQPKDSEIDEIQGEVPKEEVPIEIQESLPEKPTEKLIEPPEVATDPAAEVTPQATEPVVERIVTPAVPEAIDSEEILKLIKTPETPETESKQEVPESTDDIVIERTSMPEPLPVEAQEQIRVPAEEEPVAAEVEVPVEPTVQTDQDMSPLPAEPEAESTKPEKLNEEDFQSFKDWLSGLLK